MEMQGLGDERGTDVVGEVCPVYTSVEVAQSDTKDYQEKYAHPGSLDTPNEYDIVTDNQRDKNTSGYVQRETTSSGYLHRNNNVLYADHFAAQEMKHATLTRDEQKRFVGAPGEDTIKEESERKGCGLCEGPFCLWLSLALTFIFVTLVAIAALVLALLMLLQVVPVCNCAATPEQVQALVERIQVLENESVITSSNISALTQRLDMFDVVPAIENAISQRISDNGTILGLSFGAELRGFEPYSECVTRIERQCPISISADRCETPDLDYILANDPALNYTRDARCLQLPFSSDQQHVSTTLLIQDNIIFCVCERIMVDDALPVAETSCGLQMTRCRSNRNVPVQIVATSDAELEN